jgi:hypothetical protein
VPSTSKKQHNFMAAVAKNPAFAKKVGVRSSVGREFLTADKGKKFKEGGSMKHSDIAKDKPMMKKVAKEEVKAHEKAMHGKKYAKGGVTRADGCVTKGHTKGKMIAMKKGGAC